MKTNWKYMPILKWKRGERDALRFLTPAQWNGIVPLAELQPPEAANNAPPQTVQELRDEVVVEVSQAIPKDVAVAIDTKYVVKNHPNPLELLASFCSAIRKAKDPRRPIPVLHGSLVDALTTVSAATLTSLKNNKEIVLRIRIDLFSSVQISPMVAAVKKAGFKTNQIHLLIDQFSIVPGNASAYEAVVKPYVDAALIEKCASVTVAGGSFPMNLMGFKQGYTDIARVEWAIWTILRPKIKDDSLRFGDYAVTNPVPMPDISPKKVNPSISIRYTANTFWRVYKGGGFKKGKPGTLQGLCKLLVSDAIYSGPTFSYGDKQYQNKASATGEKALTNGTPWTWRRDATNHHMALTISAL